MSWLDWGLLAAATWYVSWTLTQAEGPWRVFERLRARWTRGPLQCIYCTGFWVALALYGLYQWPPARHGIAVLGIVGAALMLRAYTGVQHG